MPHLLRQKVENVKMKEKEKQVFHTIVAKVNVNCVQEAEQATLTMLVEKHCSMLNLSCLTRQKMIPLLTFTFQTVQAQLALSLGWSSKMNRQTRQRQTRLKKVEKELRKKLGWLLKTGRNINVIFVVKFLSWRSSLPIT